MAPACQPCELMDHTLQAAPDEIAGLATELTADEPYMCVFEATNQAAFMLDELDVYAAVWDSMVLLLGNDQATP